MGQKLLDYYQQAAQIGGLKAKMKLAMLTLVPSTEAANASDSPENIKKFDNAMAEIRKEFAS